MADPLIEKIVSLCKRRGFVFPSSEIYGGLNACWDFGPQGTALKSNLKALWWRSMTQVREDIEGIDSSILMAPRVWEASGHVEGFTDPLADCPKCRRRVRPDHAHLLYLETHPRCPHRSCRKDLPSDLAPRADGVLACPSCAGVLLPAGRCPTCTEADLGAPRRFNLMFKTHIGPVEETASVVYLRPETAQGIYVNFHNVVDTCRRRIPFGIAQIGKAFRNEISPGNFIFRSREFEQMEMQFFVRPGTDGEWFERWRDLRIAWHRALGLSPARLRFQPHAAHELAHYARAAGDIQYQYPFGWQEIEGIHNRGDYDLGRHQEYSGKDLRYFDDEAKQHYLPCVVETSVGPERLMMACLVDAYREEEVQGETRVVLRLSPAIAPYQVAVFPLVNRDGMPERARSLAAALRERFKVFLDEKGAIGRRYRRQDEVGTPFCVTIDGDTATQGSVTLRDRDTMKQDRVRLDDLPDEIARRIRSAIPAA